MDFSAHQAQLPRLPIPELADTCAKLLAWSEPLLTPAERASSCAAEAAFRDDPAQGARLHELLQAYDAAKAAKNAA